jgi:hypothetical protein
MATWVTDVQHLVPESDKLAPARAKRRAAFTREVVEVATARVANEPWTSAVHCVARVGRRLCRGHIRILSATLESIEWCCADCPENGVITGYVGTPSDLSRYAPQGKLVFWGIDDEDRQFLLTETVGIRDLHAIVCRAQPHVDVPGLLLIDATVEELDEMYTLVEELTDVMTGRRQRDVLDALRASLCNSMDGF